jgi:hypothetical protein
MLFPFRLVVIFCFLAVIAIARAEDPTKKAAELKSLLEERHKLLFQTMEARIEEFKAGANSSIALMVQVQRELLQATLDLQTSEERKANLQKCLEMATSVADTAAARHKAEKLGRADLMQAKAMVVEVRIELLRDEMKAKPRK